MRAHVSILCSLARRNASTEKTPDSARSRKFNADPEPQSPGLQDQVADALTHHVGARATHDVGRDEVGEHGDVDQDHRDEDAGRRERDQDPFRLRPPSGAQVDGRLEDDGIDRLHGSVDGDRRVRDVRGGQRHDHREPAVEQPFDRRARYEEIDDAVAAQDHLPGVDLHHRRELVREHQGQQDEQLELPRFEHHVVRERDPDDQHDHHRRGSDEHGRPGDMQVEMIREHVDVVLQGETARRVGRELHDAHLDHHEQGEQEEDDQERDRREQDAERAAAGRRSRTASHTGAGAGAVTDRHLRLVLSHRTRHLGRHDGSRVSPRAQQPDGDIDQQHLHHRDQRRDRVHDRGVIGVPDR